MRVYLDNAATTPLDKEVLETMMIQLRDNYGNPSSIHADGRRARAVVEQARKSVANYFNSSVGEIFFTSGGTESNNMAIKGAIRDLGVKRIITSPIEHHCVIHTVEVLEKRNEIQLDYVKIDERGRIDFEHLEDLLKASAEKTLVSLMHANNEVGNLLDLPRTSALCKEHNALFHCDTVQSIGKFPLDLDVLSIDFLSGSAHKFHGPKGTGFIYINSDNAIKPLLDGGAQERNMRAGTENIAGIAGLAKALELAKENMTERREQIESVRAYLIDELTKNFKDITFNGDYDGEYLYTVLSISVPANSKTDLLVLSLDISGISASGGSACSSGVEKGSHVIGVLQNGSEDLKTVRFSFSHHNTKEEIDFLIEKLKGILPLKG